MSLSLTFLKPRKHSHCCKLTVTSMSSGNADSELYAVSKPVTANKSPDNLFPTGSMQHHQALGSQTSADTPSAALADHTSSSQKLYVASYDACHWYQPDITNKIIRLDRGQIYIDPSVTAGPPMNSVMEALAYTFRRGQRKRWAECGCMTS